MVSHFQGQILVDLVVMQRRDSLEGGWVLGPCFHSVVGILRMIPTITNLGLLVKRFVLAWYLQNSICFSKVYVWVFIQFLGHLCIFQCPLVFWWSLSLLDIFSTQFTLARFSVSLHSIFRAFYAFFSALWMNMLSNLPLFSSHLKQPPCFLEWYYWISAKIRIFLYSVVK